MRGRHLAPKTGTSRVSWLGVGLIIGLFLAMAVPAGAASTDRMGNDAIDRPAGPDSRANFVVVDKNDPASGDGFITAINYYPKRAGTMHFLIVAPTGSGDEILWMSPLVTVDSSMLGTLQTYMLAAPAGVTAGSWLGLYYPGIGTIPYTSGTDGTEVDFTTSYPSGQSPSVGDTLVYDEAYGTSVYERVYSINATVYIQPGSMDDCKNGGWEAYGFRNQGQCIASVVASDNAVPHS